MQIAKQVNGSVVLTDTDAEFPNVSGINDAYLASHGCYKVFAHRDYSPDTQKLVTTPVYIDGASAYTVRAQALSAEELDVIQEERRIAAVPVSVTPRQIRQALSRAGLRTAVESAIAAAGDQDTKDWWEFATEFERTHPMVIGMAVALGQTPLQLDDLFTLAATL